jgi:hypothetical protein
MGYIYQADVYCDDCGNAIRRDLKSHSKAPEDVMEHSSYDSDDFPKDADVENEESDTPEHCAKCHKFLLNPLTSDGYRYVKEQLDATGSQKFSGLSDVLNIWAHWYNFTYWDQADCEEDGRYGSAKGGPAWYSSESF